MLCNERGSVAANELRADMRRIIQGAAWLSAAALIIVTLGPIWLRPVTEAPAGLERFAAYLAAGALFGLAYPKNTRVIIALIAIYAGVLELGQHLVVGRHGTLSAFAIKAAGGWIGVLFGNFALAYADRRTAQ